MHSVMGISCHIYMGGYDEYPIGEETSHVAHCQQAIGRQLAQVSGIKLLIQRRGRILVLNS
jgi:hypothetical protein